MAQPILFDTIRFSTRKYVFENKDVSSFGSNMIGIYDNRIGIGTDTPSENYICTIEGDTLIRGNLTATTLYYTSSNLTNIMIDNNGSYPNVDLIQRGSQPFLTMRQNNTKYVGIIQSDGNVGIGLSTPHDKLVVDGVIVASNVKLLGNYVAKKGLQVSPVHRIFTVNEAYQYDFELEMTGLYKALPEDTQVFLNGYKLAYTCNGPSDYTVTYENDYAQTTSRFVVTITNGAPYRHIVDITIWPSYLTIPEALEPGWAAQTINAVFWNKNSNEHIVTEQLIGIGTTFSKAQLYVYKQNYNEIDMVNVYNNSVDRTAFVINSSNQIGFNTSIPTADYHIVKPNTVSTNILKIETEPNSEFPTLVISSNEWFGIKVPDPQAMIHVKNYLNGDLLKIEDVDNAQTGMIIKKNGFVGIGSYNPISKLDVYGLVNATMFAGDGSLLYNLPAGSFTVIGESNDMYYEVGNIGIGTTFPRLKMDVYGGHFILNNGNIGIGTTNPTKQLYVRGQSYFGGNVGIGTLNPRYSLHSTAGVKATTYEIDKQFLGKMDDTANIPSYSFKGEETTGVYMYDSGAIGMSAAGENMLVVKTTGITVGTKQDYLTSIPPIGNGMVNNVNITNLNKRVRTSSANTKETVSTWISRVADIYAWKSVCWADELGLFVAVGYNDRAMYSRDGIVWASVGAPNINDWTSVCWAKEKPLFVAVAYSSSHSTQYAMTSTNGISWSGRAIGGEKWNSVCWSPELSLFVAVSDATTNNLQVAVSSTGITWTLYLGAAYDGITNWKSVCWSPELKKFVAVANNGTYRSMSSEDGANWTLINTSDDNNNWNSICWSPELMIFVAVSGSGVYRVMVSTDGISWNGYPAANENVEWRSVCWCPELSIFVAVGGTDSNRVMYSYNGTSWFSVTSANEGCIWNSICWSPETSQFVAVGEQGSGNIVMTSSIGIPNKKSAVLALPTQVDVDALGNVGIGTTQPRHAMDIIGSMILTGNVGVGTTMPRHMVDIRNNASILGNVGIGTTIINAGLHIYSRPSNYIQLLVETGITDVGAADEDARILVKSKQTGESQLILENLDDGVSNYMQFAYDASKLYIEKGTSADYSVGTKLVTITNSGNVGIGSSSPWTQLDVNTGMIVTNATVRTSVGIGTTVHREELDIVGSAHISTNIGIGTILPQNRLHISSATTAIELQNNNEIICNDNTRAFRYGITNTATTMACTAAGGYRVYVGGTGNLTGTQALTILSGGNVGVKNTNPATYALTVTGDIYASANIIAYSDERAKTDLQEIKDAVEKVKQLTGYTYLWKSNETTHRSTGLIAQQVEKVLPEVVFKDQNDQLGISYGNMAGLFVEALKDIVRRIERIEEKMNL